MIIHIFIKRTKTLPTRNYTKHKSSMHQCNHKKESLNMEGPKGWEIFWGERFVRSTYLAHTK